MINDNFNVRLFSDFSEFLNNRNSHLMTELKKHMISFEIQGIDLVENLWVQLFSFVSQNLPSLLGHQPEFQ